MSAIVLDPLVVEAKRRARRRRLLLALVATGLIAAGAAAVATTTPQRSHVSSVPLGSPRSSSLGVCARTPAGWQKRTGWEMSLGPRTLGLTNFRFGRTGDPFDTYGLLSYAHRPKGSILIELDAQSPVDAQPRFKRSLHVTRDDFSTDFYGEMSWPSAYIETRMHDGGVRTALVVVAAVTPATIAAANEALAGVRTCSA
jgi:hypothetical protein